MCTCNYGCSTAAVAASSTEKGFSIVSDGVITTKLADKFLRTDVDLTQGVSISKLMRVQYY